MDYCRSTGILTIFWWTTDYIDWSFRISKKKRVPVARPGIGVLRCFSGRFSTRFEGWVSIWNPENDWWMRSWFDKSLNVLRTSCKDFGTGFYHTGTCTLYRNDTVISIHLSKKVSWDEPSRSRPLFFFWVLRLLWTESLVFRIIDFSCNLCSDSLTLLLETVKMVKTDWILGEAFDIRSPHHESIKALWETKWRFPVRTPVSCCQFEMAGCVSNSSIVRKGRVSLSWR